MPTIQIRARAGRITCGWCRSAAGEQARCPGCAASYHPDCLEERGSSRCGTLGCRAVVPSLAPVEPPPARLERCAACGLPEVVLPLCRCPHDGRRYHRGCRSQSCAACRPAEPLAAWIDRLADLAIIGCVVVSTAAATASVLDASSRCLLIAGPVAGLVGTALVVRRLMT